MNSNEQLVLYKKGSRGEIVGVYGSVKDLVKAEQVYNSKFDGHRIYEILTGRQKSYHSFAHQCKVVVKKRLTD